MQNRKTDKSAFLLLLAVAVFLISFFVIDKFALARFLGSAYATIFDPPFTILLIIGSLTTLKFGPLRTAIICSVVYTALTFSVIRDWQIQLGIYDGAAMLLSKKLSASVFVTAVLFSVIGTIQLLILSAIRNDQSDEASSSLQLIFESEWKSNEGSEYTRYEASFDDNGTLTITGQDLSATAEKIWGDEEVEYYYDIPQNSQRSLAFRLLLKKPLKVIHWVSVALPRPFILKSLTIAFNNTETRLHALQVIKKRNTRRISAW